MRMPAVIEDVPEGCASADTLVVHHVVQEQQHAPRLLICCNFAGQTYKRFDLAVHVAIEDTTAGKPELHLLA